MPISRRGKSRHRGRSGRFGAGRVVLFSGVLGGLAAAFALVLLVTSPRAGSAWDGRGGWTPNWLGGPRQITHPPNVSYEIEAFDPARVAFTPGGLRLSIRRDPVAVDGVTYPYRSGVVTGYRKQAYVFGYFSARIFVPCAGGRIVNWPAFWLVGNPYKWPATGEIDVFEGLGGRAWWHFHFRRSSGTPGSDGGESAGDYCGWHTFAVDWRPVSVRWYYDGVLVGVVTANITRSPMFPVFSYSVTDPGSAMCARYRDICGGEVDVGAVMRVSGFTVRPG